MKTPKEIKLATSNFLSAFEKNEISKLEGTFIPFSTIQVYKQHQFYLISAALFGFLFLYLLYNAWFVDSIYYWHIDLPVIIGILIIFTFFCLFLALANKYFETSKQLKSFLTNPNDSSCGIIITEDYYFEKLPNEYHIIPRDNIVKIDHIEHKDDAIYLELLLDMGTHYEMRGLTYHETEYDIKSWVEKN